jgi:hypothetical protein
LQIGDVPSAITYLEKGFQTYEMLRQNAKTGGDRRSLYGTMATLAQAYCMNKQYDNGLKLFNRAINEEGAHVGQYHFQLGYKYLNAGLCARSAKQHKEALRLLGTSHDIMKKNPTHFSRDTISTVIQSIKSLENQLQHSRSGEF